MAQPPILKIASWLNTGYNTKTPLSGKRLVDFFQLEHISRSSVAVDDRSHQCGGTHAAKMKFLRVSLVHPENPDILV